MANKNITMSRAALDELVTRAAMEAVERVQGGKHHHRRRVEYDEEWSSDSDDVSDEAPPSMVARTKGPKGGKKKEVKKIYSEDGSIYATRLEAGDYDDCDCPTQKEEGHECHKGGRYEVHGHPQYVVVCELHWKMLKNGKRIGPKSKPERCHGVTRDEEPCTGWAQKDGDGNSTHYCYNHRHQAPKAPEERRKGKGRR